MVFLNSLEPKGRKNYLRSELGAEWNLCSKIYLKTWNSHFSYSIMYLISAHETLNEVNRLYKNTETGYYMFSSAYNNQYYVLQTCGMLT